jgi:hypothetical protein
MFLQFMMMMPLQLLAEVDDDDATSALAEDDDDATSALAEDDDDDATSAPC